jgi:quercetin dioxygenase-like cupin family protein
MAPTKQGYALSQGDGKAIWFLGALATIKASSEQTQSAFALQEHVYAPGLEPPLHLHRQQDEAFYVLEGALTVWCGDQTWSVAAGSFALLPRGLAHGFKVEGTTPVKMLVLTFPGGPAGFEHFVEEMGEPAKALTLPPPEPPDLAKLQALTSKYRIELVGPAPESEQA